MQKTTTSAQLFQQAQQYIPGGVNSPVRAFKSVGGTPRFIARGEGAYIYDVDGNAYIDCIGSWGPMILGHADDAVIAAVRQAAGNSLSFGAPCEIEITLAELVCDLIPSVDKIRMVNSGTEATMSAIRLARGYTNRNKVIKFEGCYHGHADMLLVKAGSGALTFGTPTSPGVPASTTNDTLVAKFNDLDSVKALFAANQGDIAAIILEPIPGNMNMIMPDLGFLQGLRDLCDQEGAVLIFDEVMTGFRVALGGAQALFNITPDLTCFGKVIGGGMPVGAFAGKKAIMDCVSPVGKVYQAGTLSGNPLAMTAGYATLTQLQAPGFYQQLKTQTEKLTQGLQQAADAAGVPFTTVHEAGMFGLFFTDNPQVTCYDDVVACDQARFNQFFQLMLADGVYLAPSSFEAGFLSIKHDDSVVQQIIAAAERAFAQL